MMKISTTSIPGLLVAVTAPVRDERGMFERLFCECELEQVIGGRRIVQINHSITRKTGAIRGLHFQHAPHAEMKMVRCLKGRVWDVVVDLRKNSPTLLQWHAEELSATNTKMIIIPEGCAHGFQVMDDDSELLYLHTAFYAPEFEAGILFNDPCLDITWPVAATDISPRDRKHPLLEPDFSGIET